MPACPNCGQDNPDIARFCLACGTALVQEAPPEEERRLVTALFTDIVGSTASAEELDPEDVRARLAPYYVRLRAELERHGGTVEKFIGDAVVALFGAPVAHEDDPERAVRAAIAIGHAIDELNAHDRWLDLKIRTAVNTGEALVVLGAAAAEGEGMAAGDVMNTAARLQGAAPVNGVVVGEQTFMATSDRFEYRELEPVQAKGKAEPVRVWEVVGELDAPARAPRTTLVGRAADLGRLNDLWDETRARGTRAVATVVGAPGVGKSRLVGEFTARAAEAGTVLTGHCLSYGEGITYWPVTEILKDAAGIFQSDDPETASVKLGGLLDGLATTDVDELRTMAAALANLIGEPRTPRGTYSAADISQAELHWGIRRVLELLARERPLLLVFEDLHWAEPTLLDLVRFVAEGDGESPILVLGSARPEVLETGHPVVRGNGYRHVVELDALGEEESRTLLGELMRGLELPERLVETVLRNAGGNPLFLEETVRMLADEGYLDGGERPELLESLPVPSTLQALIGSRLDRLAPTEKRVAQHASVVGVVFWPSAVATLAETNGELDDALEELERRDFVRPTGDSSIAGDREYQFKHILIRDVAYGRVPKRRRAELHVRCADWVEALPAAYDEFVEIVAYHLEQSCRLTFEIAHAPTPPPTQRAVKALSRAAEKAERREGLREADRFYTRALELVGADSPETEAELRVRRGTTLVALGQLDRAREELEAVAEQALALERGDLRCAALLGVANLLQKQGRAEEARGPIAEADTLAAESGDGRLRVRAAFEQANLVSWFEGSAEPALADLRRALDLAAESGDRALLIEGHMRLGTVLFNIGDLEEAEAELAVAATLAGERGSHRDEARTTSMLGVVRFYLGKIDEAEELELKAADWLERTGEAYLRLQNLRSLARIALARGQPTIAEQRLQEAVPLALESGGWLLIEVYRYLVEALVDQGRHEEGRELALFAARNLPEEDLYARAALLIAEGIVAAAFDEHASTVASFEEAIRLLEQQDMLTDLGEARLAFARALHSLGEESGARMELERARAAFKRVHADGFAAELDKQLT